MDDDELAARFACALISSGHYPTYQSKDAACLIVQQAWAMAGLFRQLKPDHLAFEGVEQDHLP